MKPLICLNLAAVNQQKIFVSIFKCIDNENVNYQWLSRENVCSIGSRAVESAVKQIGRRLKISGAQWLSENVNQMLKLRCAYLNALLSV